MQSLWLGFWLIQVMTLKEYLYSRTLLKLEHHQSHCVHFMLTLVCCLLLQDRLTVALCICRRPMLCWKVACSVQISGHLLLPTWRWAMQCGKNGTTVEIKLFDRRKKLKHEEIWPCR